MDDRLERIGVITDAHANLPATMAALAAMDDVGCDLIIHTGDAIGIGPHPREVLDLLLSRPDVLCLMGNHDEWFAFDLLGTDSVNLDAGEMAHQKWTHAQLPESWRARVAQWPYTHEAIVGDSTIRFTHYARANDAFALIAVNGDPVELDNLFQPEQDFVFFGHHHPRCDVQGRARYINPGALGTNPGEGARFALITNRQDGVEVSLHAVEYDVTSVREGLVSRDVPEAEFILDVFLGG